MNDHSPSLSQPRSDAPGLGGDRRPVACRECGELTIRDLFGQSVCLRCTANFARLADLQKTLTCPFCGAVDNLEAHLDHDDRILAVECQSCETYAWTRRPDYHSLYGNGWKLGYLTEDGVEEIYWVYTREAGGHGVGGNNG